MDRAEIDSLSEAVRTPAGAFQHVLKVAESTPLEIVHEYKYYVRDIGLVSAGSAPAYLPLASGYVALTIPTGEQVGVAGHITLGDYVTVIASGNLGLFPKPGAKVGAPPIKRMWDVGQSAHAVDQVHHFLGGQERRQPVCDEQPDDLTLTRLRFLSDDGQLRRHPGQGERPFHRIVVRQGDAVETALRAAPNQLVE